VEFAGVAKPERLKVADLKRIGLGSVTMVLQCSGNGRGYFPHKPAGDPWTVGAAGCITFSGVPVRDVVQALGGVAGGMRYMTSTGGEILPASIERNQLVIERSVPWDAMEQALLAWEINGEPLPLAHGGPLRMIVPGYFGINNIKYVKQVAFTLDQSPAKVQQTVYRFSPIGVPGASSQPTMWRMPVNSWVTTPYQPGKPISAGRVQLAGVAFGGFNAVQAVEVSLDGGQNWRVARWFGPDLGRYAWRNFVLEADLKPGKYRIASRATDDEGHVQPQNRVENNSGFANNSWADHSYELEVV
jgi:sulfite dehydrogenase